MSSLSVVTFSCSAGPNLNVCFIISESQCQLLASPQLSVTPSATRNLLEPCTSVAATSSVAASRPASMQTALEKYTVPWSQLPFSKEVKKALTQSTRLPVPLMRKFVKVVGDNILSTVFKSDTGRPGKTFLERIAKQAMLQFPGAITTVLDGQVVGTGYDDLLHKLVNRFDNINRNVSSLIRQKRACNTSENDNDNDNTVENDETETPPTSLRRQPKMQKLSDKYGCIAWQPPEPDDLEADIAELMRQQLVDMDVENDEFKSKFKKLYYLQRQDINGSVPLAELKVRWPYLFTADGLLIHFEELTGINVKVQLLISLEKKLPRLLHYFASKPLKKKHGVTDALSAINAAKAEMGNNNPAIIGVISVLCAYFNEDINQLITAYEVVFLLLSSNH